MDGLTKPDDSPEQAKPADSTVDELTIPPAANDQAPFVRIDPAAPPGPGGVLRAEREARGYSIDDVATALKLAPRQVEAIEADDFDALRGQTFARGFVKNYARLLQLDPDPLVARIKSSAPPVRVSIEPRSNASVEVPLSGGGQGPVVAGGLAVLALVVVAVVGTSGDWLGGDPKSRDNRGPDGEGRASLSQTSGMAAPPQHSPLSASLAGGAEVSAPVASEPAQLTPPLAATSGPAAAPGAAPAAAVPANAGVGAPNSAASATASVAASQPKAFASPGPTSAAQPPAPAAPAAGNPASPVAQAGMQAKPALAGTSASAVQSTSATAASASAVKPAAPRTSGTVMSFTTPKPATSSATTTQPAGADPAPRATDFVMTTAAPKARGDKRMVLSFEQEAWVEVRDGDGKVVFSQLNPAGANRVVEGKAPLSFVVGNAHHVKLKVDDKPFDLKPHIGVTVARFSVQ